MISLNFKILKKALIFIFVIIDIIFILKNKNIHAASEENVITYSLRVTKEILNLIASDRFGDQSEDFTDEILKKNTNLSKFQIIHKGSEITFIINFNTFIIEKGDTYMIDKAFKLPIAEEITFDKYLMYRMVAKEYQPNADDTQNIINKTGHKITIGKIMDEYELIFKMKFKIDIDALSKNDNSRSWIINYEDTSQTSPVPPSQESTSLAHEEKTDKIPSSDLKDISMIARSYIDAQKKKEEEDLKLKKEENERINNELKEKAQVVIEMKRREEAIKKMAKQKQMEEEEKQKKEDENNKLKIEKKRKEDEAILKRKKEEEILTEQSKLVIEIQKKEQERINKEKKQSEIEKKTMDKRANERTKTVLDVLSQKEKKYKLAEEIKMLEQQAKIEFEKKKKEEEKNKKEEEKFLIEERKIMDERRKKSEEEQKYKEEEEKLRQEEIEKKELVKKKENEKKISVQAKMQGAVLSKEIICKKVFREPEIDGRAENTIWDNTNSFAVIVRNPKELEKSLAIKSIYTTNYIYFYIQWEDYTENVTHKTWLWDKNNKQYAAGDDIEDKLNLMFAIKNNFSACMLTGLDYEADLWEWAAAKTNPSGFADDQKIIISSKPIKRANSFKSYSGRKLWIKNIFDPGTACYEQNIIIDYKWDKVPRYIPKNPSGSRSDIRSKGVWKDSIWMLEIRRKLLTDDKANDVQFNINKKYPFAIAIYDQQETNNHYTSDELLLIFVQ